MSAIDQSQDGSAASDVPRPLVVDLDGSLLRTDLLHEGFWRLASVRPLQAVRLALANLSDRAKLKIALAESADLEVETLPVNDAVAARLAEARAAGRPVLIATASEQKLAERVAAHIAPGVEVLGTTPERNLKGRAKAKALEERFGAGGFDYIGDSETDLAVWRVAGRAIAVNPSPKIAAALNGRASGVDTIAEGPRLNPLLKALRLH